MLFLSTNEMDAQVYWLINLEYLIILVEMYYFVVEDTLENTVRPVPMTAPTIRVLMTLYASMASTATCVEGTAPTVSQVNVLSAEKLTS